MVVVSQMSKKNEVLNMLMAEKEENDGS